MTRTVDVGIMSRFGRVLDVRSRDGDASLPLFWCFVNSAIFKKACQPLLLLSFCDGCCQCGLESVRRCKKGGEVLGADYFAMINVTDCTCNCQQDFQGDRDL